MKKKKLKKRKFKGFQVGSLFFGSSGRYLLAHNRATPEEHRKKLITIAKDRPEALKKIAKKTKELERIIGAYDPLDLIANFSFLNVFIDPETYKEYSFEGNQSHLEFLTLLCLKQKYLHREKTKIPGIELEKITNLIKEIFGLTIFYQETAWIDINNPSTPTKLEELQTQSFLNSLMVRGPGYPHHQEELLKDLFSHNTVQEWMEKNLGFAIKDIISIPSAIASLMENRIHERRDNSIREKKELLSNYQDYKKTKKIKHKKYADLFKKLDNVSMENQDQFLNNTLAAWVFFCLGDVFSFIPNDITKIVNVGAKEIKQFFEFFSIDFGAIDENYYLPTPVHRLHFTPIIKHHSGYLCPAPTLLLWSIRVRLEELMKRDKKFWNSYEQIRHKYLLRTGLSYLNKIFNTDRKTYTNLEFPEGELDGMIQFDRTCMLIEAKAGEFTIRSKSGYRDRLQKDAKYFVKKSHEQGIKAKKYILSSKKVDFTKDKEKIEFSAGDFDSYLFITISLDNIDLFAQNLPQLKILGLTEEDSMPWVVSLLDLKVISEIVEFPTQFLHYLSRRVSMNEREVVHAHDELDYLIHYMEEGLDFSEQIEMGLEKFGLMSYTTPLDDYYAYSTGLRKKFAPKPSYKMPDLFRELVLNLDKAKGDGYTEPIMLLLDMTEASKERLIETYKTQRKLALEDGKAHDFTIFSDRHSAGITWFVIGGKPSSEHFIKLLSYCELKKYQTHSGTWLGLLTFASLPGIIYNCVYKKEPWKFNKKFEELIKILPPFKIE